VPPSSTTSSGRPRCAVFIATSVDGYIARRDGTIDWLASVEREGEDYGYKKFMSTVDTVVLGRNTYDFISREPSWPFQGKRVVVLTHRPASAKHGETFFAGKPEQLLEQLAKKGVQNVYVDGGNAVRGFLSAGLIAQMTISVVPVVLGAGIPLFGDGIAESALVLEESRAFSTGLIQLRYRLGAQGKDRRPTAPISATR
jgi:dihydrofolate reductase